MWPTTKPNSTMPRQGHHDLLADRGPEERARLSCIRRSSAIEAGDAGTATRPRMDYIAASRAARACAGGGSGRWAPGRCRGGRRRRRRPGELGQPEPVSESLASGQVRGEDAGPGDASVARLEHPFALAARPGLEPRGQARQLGDDGAGEGGQAVAAQDHDAGRDRASAARGPGRGGRPGAAPEPPRGRPAAPRRPPRSRRSSADAAPARARRGPSRSAPRSRRRAGRRRADSPLAIEEGPRARGREELVDGGHARDDGGGEGRVREADALAVQDRVEGRDAPAVRGGHEHEAADAPRARPGHRRGRRRARPPP